MPRLNGHGAARPRLALVVPRYGEDILGGAENMARGLAEQATAAGLAEVEVFTTCASDHVAWTNDLPAGLSHVNGVPVRRFPIDIAGRDARRYTALHARLSEGQWLSLADQYDWLKHSAHSSELYAALAARGGDFDWFIFIPYLFGTTYYGSAIRPERSILWPCLHDEVYAYLGPTHDMFQSCRGIMFNSAPEMWLARRLFGRHPGGRVVGFGLTTVEADAERFRREAGLTGPFILYSGRLEGGKNVPSLLSHFITYKHMRGGPLKLALMGRGPEPIPNHPDIVQLGFRQGQAKLDAYAAATLLCQPSVFESFSIVIMEAWLAGVPVLVHADCEVTRHHATQSNGGLYFRSYDEFEAALDLLLAQPDLLRQMGANGRGYVRQQYGWPAVLERFAAALAAWKGQAEPAPAA